MKEFSTPAVVPADPRQTRPQLLIDRVALDPTGLLFALPAEDGVGPTSRPLNSTFKWSPWQRAFMAAGIKAGDKVGFMCKTRYEWTLVDFALWFAGARHGPYL